MPNRERLDSSNESSPSTWWSDVVRVATEESREVRPRLHAALGLGSLLPQFCFNRVRTSLLRNAGISIGEDSLFMGELTLSGAGDWGSLLSVGQGTMVSGPLRINLGGAVRIGSNVTIGHDCLLIAVNHEIGTAERRAGLSIFESIVIEDGSWIASRVTVLPGVTIGKGAVVSAGALVASDVEPNTVVGGTPAKLLRRL